MVFIQPIFRRKVLLYIVTSKLSNHLHCYPHHLILCLNPSLCYHSGSHHGNLLSRHPCVMNTIVVLPPDDDYQYNCMLMPSPLPLMLEAILLEQLPAPLLPPPCCFAIHLYSSHHRENITKLLLPFLHNHHILVSFSKCFLIFYFYQMSYYVKKYRILCKNCLFMCLLNGVIIIHFFIR